MTRSVRRTCKRRERSRGRGRSPSKDTSKIGLRFSFPDRLCIRILCGNTFLPLCDRRLKGRRPAKNATSREDQLKLQRLPPPPQRPSTSLPPRHRLRARQSRMKQFLPAASVPPR